MLLVSLAAFRRGKIHAAEGGLIFDMGRGDGGFNDSGHIGMEKAVAELKVKAVYIEHKETERPCRKRGAADSTRK